MRPSNRAGTLAAILIGAFALGGCGGRGATNLDLSGGLAGVESLQQRLGSDRAPTPEEYSRVRGEFVTHLSAAHDSNAKALGSPARKIKKLIATAGSLIGLAGTASSFAVSDEDTKATIAQASGSVAGVSAIVGLLPFGSVPKGAEGVNAYLGSQLPRFERRWPAETEEPLSPEEWQRFVDEASQIDGTMRLLQK